MTEETTPKTDLAAIEQANYKAGNAGKGKYVAAHKWTPGHGPPTKFKPGQCGTLGKRWTQKTTKLKNEMLDVMGRNRAARMKVLTAALEKDGLRYLNILASLLPKEQVVDLSVHGGLSVLAAQMTDEELLRIAMAMGLDVPPDEGTVDLVEQDGEINDENQAETCGSETEQSSGADGDSTPT